jgi:hypothetical protein
MHSTNFWHLLHLHRHKVALLLLLLASLSSLGQKSFRYNLPFSDKRPIHYGFSIGIHSSSLQLKYSDKFVTNQLDTLNSTMPGNAFGFSVGPIIDFRIVEQFKLRILPKVSFYEFPVDYNYTRGTVQKQLIEATFFEVPVVVKYISERHKNFRAYFVAGIAPGFEISGKKKEEQTENRLLLEDFNVNMELGMGLDLYFPLFKFSPEVRFSKGLLNILKEDNAGFSDGIESLKMNVFTIYIQFSD